MSESISDKLEFSNHFNFDSSAYKFCEELQRIIVPLQRSLPPFEALFAIFSGYDGEILLTDIYPISASVVSFAGLDADKKPVHVYQHISRIDFILKQHILPSDDHNTCRPIGFHFPDVSPDPSSLSSPRDP